VLLFVAVAVGLPARLTEPLTARIADGRQVTLRHLDLALSMPTDIVEESWYDALEVIVERPPPSSELTGHPGDTLRMAAYENVQVRFRPGWLDVAHERGSGVPVTAYPIRNVVMVAGVTTTG
jgi:hypothetical protein